MKTDSILYKSTLLLFYQYVIVTVVMMLFYHAGNRYAPNLNHFVFDQNYLSDLGRSVSFAGIDNPSYIFYSLTLCLVGIGIFLFFQQLSKTINSKIRYIILLFAIASTIAYVGIAFYPVNINLKVHVIYAQLAFFGFFITALLTHIVLDKNKFKKANKWFWLLNIMMFLYLVLIFFGPSSTLGIWALQLKTIAQKIVVYSQILLCVAILKDLRNQTK